VSYDVVVIGAGIIGASVARDLARDGWRVAVLERTASASGTSGSGEGNILVSDKGPGAELDLARVARSRWGEVAPELDDELGAEFPSIEFQSKGGIVVATRESAVEPLLSFAATQRKEGVTCSALSVDEALSLEPRLNPGIGGAVWYPDDAQVQPVIATEAFLASARRAGAEVFAAAEALGAIDDSSGRIQGVRTKEGDFRAPVVVNASGPWSGEVGARLGAPLPVRPRRGVVLVTSPLQQSVHHKVYDGDYVGAVGSDSGALQISSVVESTPAGTVLIGSSRERVGFRDDFSASTLGRLAQKSLRLFPFLAAIAVMRAYSGFRPYMPDHLPVIGPDPRREGLWHATGHEGAGVGLSVATSALIADLLAGRQTSIDPAPFSVARTSLAPYLEKAG